MKVDFQRKVDRYAGSLICGMLSLFPKADRTPPLSGKLEKILIILLSEMGSLVLAQPMFEKLKEKFPDAAVYTLMFEQNKEVLELLRVIPSEHMLTVKNRTLSGLLRDSIDVVRKIRKLGIDTVIDCELFSRISSIYSFLSGAETRVGFHPHTQEGLYRGRFINRPVLYNPYLHMSQQFLTLVEAVDSDRVPAAKRAVSSDAASFTVMKTDETEILEMFRKFHADFPHISGDKLVLLHPGGGLLPIRAWPLSYYGQLAEELLQQGCVVGIIGMREDRHLAKGVLSRCRHRNCIDLTGYTATVKELMVLFQFSDLLISNDGGPGHFASVSGLPAIVFYGPETPVLYGPLSSLSVPFYAQLSCSPCLTAYNHRNSPCDGDNLCLKLISPESVFSRACDMLEKERAVSFSNAYKKWK